MQNDQLSSQNIGVRVPFPNTVRNTVAKKHFIKTKDGKREGKETWGNAARMYFLPAKISTRFMYCAAGRILKSPFSHISITFDEKERDGEGAVRGDGNL